MSAVGSAINAAPNPFGGFAPFPNSIMIPFMGAQSAVLGYQFGISYEWGKRLIKAMDNAEFNQLVTDETARAALQNGIKQWNQQTIQRFTEELPSFTGLQNTIIEETVKIELAKANRTPSAITEILQALGTSSAAEVKTQVDQLSETERIFALSVSPMLALLYYFGDVVTQPPPTTECPEGYSLVNGECIQDFIQCEPGYDWAVPTSASDPTHLDTVSIKFSYVRCNGDDSGIQNYLLNYAEHMENIQLFEGAQFDNSLTQCQNIEAQRILVEYKKGMKAAYGACTG